MPELPETSQPTLDAIYKTYTDGASDWRRNHLGASVIGQECERKIWMDFRWCTNPSFDGRLLRLFQTGFNQEARLLEDLRKAGIEIISEEDGHQIRFEDFGGHYSGSLDAIGKNFNEAPATYHVVECKTMNARTFAQLKKKGVRIVKFEHYGQMQTYMGWAGLDRAFYFVVCKDTDEIYAERVYFDQAEFDRLRLKADRIIFANEPLYKIGDDVDNFKCRFCHHKWSCHSTRIPEVNCRTCAFSDVADEGRWICTKFKTDLDPEQQRRWCDYHAFIPGLIPLEQVDADAEKGWIIYASGITNGYGATLSRNMQDAVDGITNGNALKQNGE